MRAWPLSRAVQALWHARARARVCVRVYVQVKLTDIFKFSRIYRMKKNLQPFSLLLVKKIHQTFQGHSSIFKNLYFSDIALALWCARAHELEVINFSQDWKKKKKKYVFCTSCSEKNVKSFPASYLSIFHKKSSSFQTSSREFYKGALTRVRVHEHMSPWCTTGK